MLYLSIEEVKRIKGTENLSDEEIKELVEEIEGIVDDYCNTSFVLNKFFQKSVYKEKIYLIKQPVLSVEKVVFGNEELSNINDYIADIQNGVIKLICGYQKGDYEIKYIYGYEEVPKTVKNVVKDLIRYELNKDEIANTLLSESFDGEYSYTKKDNTIEMYKEILSKLDIFVVDKIDTLRDDKKKKITARWF